MYASKIARIDKRRSFFYRPEYIVDAELWSVLRKGEEILTKADTIEEMTEEEKEIAATAILK